MAKILTGTVVSNKADKTVVVLVETRKTHPIYRKQYTTSRRISAHDEENQAKVGDKVVIVETRPVSATKSFRLESITASAGIQHQTEADIDAVDVENKTTKETE